MVVGSIGYPGRRPRVPGCGARSGFVGRPKGRRDQSAAGVVRPRLAGGATLDVRRRWIGNCR